MTLQPLDPVNCASLIQPGCSLLQLDGEVLLFGQKGWPKRSCPTGVFGVRLKCGEMKLRPLSFSNDSCYLPPLRCPAVCRLDPYDGLPESYLIHGGRTPNNEISSSLYMLTIDSRGCNRKLTLCCKEKELVGEVPTARYGHTMSMVQSHGKTACVLFGGRSYMPAGERTTETWNSVVDCRPQVFLLDLEFGCSSAHTLPELTDGQSFHLALAREDCVYFIGGHSLTSDCRPPRLFRLRVELLQGSPLLSCETLDTGISISSAIITRTGPAHKYIILGGYQADSKKRMECTTVSFQTEGQGQKDEGTQGCSQESTDYEDSTPLEDSEELYFGREPHELEDSDEERDTYNEEDEEDESQTGYWIKCCLGCQVDHNTWEPYYSTELHRPAMIFCSRGEEGHWVHAQCMELSENLLVKLSQGSKKYFCLDHGGLPHQEMTPPRQIMPVKRTPMKVKDRKTPPTIKMSPAKKSFFRRLFE
ncbi:V(D)J recombination activating protein 2 [Collichthys lucidus]|uniref:V(D)J recombination-activating protein 2 n=1 Tax=Collichthys lucidus TaxID=240159 RepID=A0A4U5UF10_COLLU|nr:V(D)J recombination activating protein 2 [Collichthys lucidus]